MKTTSIWFPKHGDSIEFEVEYVEDKELYYNGVNIESIKLHGVEMYDYFNETALVEFKELLVEKLK